jgi:uncharacterized protein (DUF302 family)/uncharacterized membrane protein YidH (DUF202 family)
MNGAAGGKPKGSLSDYLAAERTFLAWIRTGIALMAFGFVVARFGLFLQQFQIIEHAGPTKSTGLSLWIGTALIAAGVFVNLVSARHHAQLIKQLDRGETERSHPARQAVVIAVFLAVVGIAMAIYVVKVRGPATVHSENLREGPMEAAKEAKKKGIISNASHHSVDETVERLRNILESKGVTVFALVDHSGEAAKAGMTMRPTKLLIFGSPKAGTPLMVAAPSTAIDLPLKILVWEDGEGKIWLSYNSSEYLQERHGFPRELLQNIAVVETLVAKAAE